MTANEIENLVLKYGDDLYRFCCHLTLGRDMADELYQETFLKAVQLSHKLDEGGNPKSYLMGIAANLWKNYIHKKARRHSIAPQVELEETLSEEKNDILDDIMEKEILLEMKKSLCKLSEKYRMVFILFYAEEQSIEEIGKLLRIPKGTVKSRLSKAREIMRKEMEAKGYEL